MSKSKYDKIHKDIDRVTKEALRQDEEVLNLLDEMYGEEEEEEDDFIPYSEFENMDADEFVSRSVKPVQVSDPAPEPKKEKNLFALIMCFSVALACFGLSYYLDHVVGDFMAWLVVLGAFFLIVGIIKY